MLESGIDLRFEPIAEDYNLADYAGIEDYFASKHVMYMQRLGITKRKLGLEFKFSIFNDPVKFARDNLCTSYFGLAMKRNHILYATFRDGFVRLAESGIINRVKKGYDLDSVGEGKLEVIHFKIHNRKKEPQVLKWEHLKAGFIVWFVAVILSTLIFVTELVYYKLTISATSSS